MILCFTMAICLLCWFRLMDKFQEVSLSKLTNTLFQQWKVRHPHYCPIVVGSPIWTNFSMFVSTNSQKTFWLTFIQHPSSTGLIKTASALLGLLAIMTGPRSATGSIPVVTFNFNALVFNSSLNLQKLWSSVGCHALLSSSSKCSSHKCIQCCFKVYILHHHIMILCPHVALNSLAFGWCSRVDVHTSQIWPNKGDSSYIRME